MGFRHLYIRSARFLSLRQNNIVVSRDDKEDLLMPIDDVYSILLEDPNCNISARLISELSSRGVGLVLCDSRYMPSSQLISMNLHYNQVGIIKKQLEASEQLKAQIWKQIIRKKINNQKLVVQSCTDDVDTFNLLDEYTKEVKVGDKENKEGAAARAYFKTIFGPNFIRFGSTPISLALNYGYSILSGSIIRQCIFYGLNTNFGIWHNSNGNAYNLAYDLIEAYRPYVDHLIFWHIDKLDDPLPKDIRKQLIDILNQDALIEDKKYKVENAISITIQSYIKCLESGDYKYIKLPDFLETRYFEERD